MTSKEIEAEFRKEFQALLNKYEVSFELVTETHSRGYMTYDSTHAEITIHGKWHPETYECEREYHTFELEAMSFEKK